MKELDFAQERVNAAARYFDDPMGFVMYAYPWDSDKEIQVVELEEPWASRYNSKYGPDKWACEFLDDLRDEILDRKIFDEWTPIRMSTVSGHGVGKSTMTAWLVEFLMVTRPNCKGTLTANTSFQLETKTWAEVVKWHRKSIFEDWFEVSAGRSSMKMVSKETPETWRCDAVTCREENSEAFAGQHAATSSPWYIFDEASAVPDKIWEVSEGGMTDGQPFFFAWGNGTRNDGKFYRTHHREKALWRTRSIDSRTVSITNKAEFAEWEKVHGEDSDFFRVRVAGKFPKLASMQFISAEDVYKAQKRDVPYIKDIPLMLMADPARFGDDQSVIRFRRGRDAKSMPVRKWRGLSTMMFATKITEAIEEFSPDYVFVDGGGVGGGVVDRLVQLGHDPIEVGFGTEPSDKNKFYNKRDEMYSRLRDWLRAGGCIDDDDELYDALVAMQYWYDDKDRLRLESKKLMKKRDLQSPDDADALAMSFAEKVDPVPKRSYEAEATHESEYDPYAEEAA